MSDCAGEYHQFDTISVAKVANSEYPNRIWLNQYPNILTNEILKEIQSTSFQSIEPLTFSYFANDGFQNEDEKLQSFGFVKKSEQYGMSLALTEKILANNKLQLKKIEIKEQSEIWSDVFSKCFGYHISAESVYKSKSEIEFYLLYYQENTIGTLVLHQTENIMGVHSLGVLPEFRKLGFAEEIMCQIINQSIENQSKIITLQSSPMGRNLYLKLGFEEDFLMMNYALTNILKSKNHTIKEQHRNPRIKW
ncbi:GNAT family N-acetyltransferase [Capnocytophaga sp. ARDL2]